MVWISLGLSVAAIVTSGWVAWTTRGWERRHDRLEQDMLMALRDISGHERDISTLRAAFVDSEKIDIAQIIKAATDPVVEVYRPRQVDAPVNEPASTATADPDSDPAYWDTYDPTDETIPATMPTQHGLPMLPGVDLPEFPKPRTDGL